MLFKITFLWDFTKNIYPDLKLLRIKKEKGRNELQKVRKYDYTIKDRVIWTHEDDYQT